MYAMHRRESRFTLRKKVPTPTNKVNSVPPQVHRAVWMGGAKIRQGGNKEELRSLLYNPKPAFSMDDDASQ